MEIQEKQEEIHNGKFVSNIKEWIKTILIALVVSFAFKATVVQSYEVPTGSMEPTIMPGDRLLASRLTYHFRDPRPGDIITFVPPESVPGRKTNFLGQIIPFVKRVVAVEGDLIEVRNQEVYRNHVPRPEPYINEPPCYNLPPLRVPEGKLFVLGDNRCNSLDSHIWGFLPRKAVEAAVFFRFWPISRIGIPK
jgi:signal peptidase I